MYMYMDELVSPLASLAQWAPYASTVPLHYYEGRNSNDVVTNSVQNCVQGFPYRVVEWRSYCCPKPFDVAGKTLQ